MRAEALFSWRLGQLQANPGLEPLSLCIHQRHEGNRAAGQLCGETRDVVEGFFGRRVEDAVGMERSKSRDLVRRQGGRVVTCLPFPDC